jgi:hypothetical protein
MIIWSYGEVLDMMKEKWGNKIAIKLYRDKLRYFENKAKTG